MSNLLRLLAVSLICGALLAAIQTPTASAHPVQTQCTDPISTSDPVNHGEVGSEKAELGAYAAGVMANPTDPNAYLSGAVVLDINPFGLCGAHPPCSGAIQTCYPAPCFYDPTLDPAAKGCSGPYPHTPIPLCYRSCITTCGTLACFAAVRATGTLSLGTHNRYELLDLFNNKASPAIAALTVPDGTTYLYYLAAGTHTGALPVLSTGGYSVAWFNDASCLGALGGATCPTELTETFTVA